MKFFRDTLHDIEKYLNDGGNREKLGRETPKCFIHKIDMHLMTGLHRESGGFVDNYWACQWQCKCCGHRCNVTHEARNRKEAELDLRSY